VNTKVSTVSTNLDVANENINTANTKIGTVSTNLDMANKNINVANTKIGTVSTNLDTANKNINTANTKISTINTNLNTANKNINISMSKINETKRELININQNQKLDYLNPTASRVKQNTVHNNFKIVLPKDRMNLLLDTKSDMLNIGACKQQCIDNTNCGAISYAAMAKKCYLYKKDTFIEKLPSSMITKTNTNSVWIKGTGTGGVADTTKLSSDIMPPDV